MSTEGPSSPNPWGSLEPEGDGPGAPVPLYPEVGSWRTLGRGLRKRCPRCASGGVFSSWFTLRAACPRCELRFEKEEGGYLGAMVLNFIVAVGLWVALLAVWLVFTVPDVPVLPLSIASCVLLIVVPLLRCGATPGHADWSSCRTVREPWRRAAAPGGRRRLGRAP